MHQRLDEEDSICCQCNSRNDPVEALNTVALVFILTGLVICGIAFLYPTDYYFDPSLSAEEMETIELYYARLERDLNAVALAGIICVAIGGLIIGSIIMFMVIKGDFIMHFSRQNRAEDERCTLQNAEHSRAHYGAELNEVICDKSS